MQVSIQERQIMKAALYAGFSDALDALIPEAKLQGLERPRIPYDSPDPLGRGHMFYEAELFFGDKVGRLNGFQATAIRGFNPDAEVNGLVLRDVISSIQQLTPLGAKNAMADPKVVAEITAQLQSIKEVDFKSYAAIAGQFRHKDILLSKEDKAAISNYRISNVRSKWFNYSDNLTIQDAQFIMMDIQCPRAFVKSIYDIPAQEGRTEAEQAIKGQYKEYWFSLNYVPPKDIHLKPGDDKGNKAKQAALDKDIPDGMTYLVKKPVQDFDLTTIHQFNVIGLEEKSAFKDFCKVMRRGETMELETGVQRFPLVTVAVNGVHGTWRFMDHAGRYIDHDDLRLSAREISAKQQSIQSSVSTEKPAPQSDEGVEKKNNVIKPPSGKKNNKEITKKPTGKRPKMGR